MILGRLYRGDASAATRFARCRSRSCAAARVGNLIDRITSADGVVDFIDIGFRDSRWPTFNIADMAVSLGAFLLAWVLWGEDAEAQAVPETVGVPAPATVAAEPRELS